MKNKNPIGEDFHHQTRITRETSNIEMKNIMAYNSTPELAYQGKTHYKYYPLAPRFLLKPQLNKNKSLFKDLCLKHSSQRGFTPDPIDFIKLSNILRLGYGLGPNDVDGFDYPNQIKKNRTVPSGGARYPIEVYLVNLNISDLQKGLYHYNVKDESLEQIQQGDYLEQTLKLYPTEINNLRTAGAIIILTALPKRTIKKYGSRGWRLIYLDAGIVAHNMSLSCQSEGIGSYICAAGYENEILSELLSVNSANEVLVLSLIIGTTNTLTK